MEKLISFIIPSRYLENVRSFLDNIEQTISDPSQVEVLIKLDDDLPESRPFIEAEVNKRPFDIKYIITPRLEGIFSVWLPVEQLFFMSSGHFIQILSDEPRFKTKHWDLILQKYKKFFPDDVFRLRLSSMKIANYATHYECTFRPDSFPIYTRKWLELTEGAGNCWGSDAYQQCVAFHFALGPGSYFNFYREGGHCRDVVVHEIEMDGLEFGVGVSPEDQVVRHKRNLKEWNRLTSHQMQEHFSYLARRMYCYMWAYTNQIKEFKLITKEHRRTISIVDREGKELLEVSYAVQRLVVYSQNLLRKVLTLPRIKASLMFRKLILWASK